MSLSFLALFAISLSSYAADSKVTEPKPAVVFTETVKRVELFDLIVYPVRIVPKISATLVSEIDGVVDQIPFPLGSRVAKGQSTVIIKNTDPIQTFRPHRVSAPVSGIMGPLEVSIGSRVVRGQRLGTITNPDSVQILMELTAGDLGLIHAGQMGDLKTPDAVRSFRVQVLGVSPTVDPATATATAELQVVSAKKKSAEALPPGLVGKVYFQTSSHQGIEIPDFAIFYRGPASFVRTIKEGKVAFVPVTLGQQRRGRLEILSGLSPGTELVLRTSRFVSDGEAVTIEKMGTP
jgi:multidrug efflux pump subunit AcrA (membrane-fusion protein)